MQLKANGGHRLIVVFGTLCAAIATTWLPQSSSAGAQATQDDDRDGLPDELEQQLAERYAPLILVEPDESNYPVSVEWLLEHSRLEYHEDCFPWDFDEPVGPQPVRAQSTLVGLPWAHGGSFGSGHRDAHCGERDSGFNHPPHRRITSWAEDPDGQ